MIETRKYNTDYGVSGYEVVSNRRVIDAASDRFLDSLLTMPWAYRRAPITLQSMLQARKTELSTAAPG